MKALFAHQPEIRRVRLTQHGKGRSGLAERGPDDNFYFVNESTGIRSDVYAQIFKTSIKIEQKWTEAEKKKHLPKGYKPDWAHMDYLKIDNYDAIQPWRKQAGPIPTQHIRSSREIIGNSPQAELAKRGITPFIVKMGYRLTPHERAIYNALNKDGYRIGKYTLQARLDYLQKHYQIREGMDIAFRALRLRQEDRPYYNAWVDATWKVETNYNPIGVNRIRGRIARSTASGIGQILNSVWNSTCNKWFRNTKKARYYRKWYTRADKEYQIDWKYIDSKLNFDEQLPGQAPPKKHIVFHSIYVFKGSRTYRGQVPVDQVFSMLRSNTIPQEMKYTYKAYLWGMWRNGHGGIRFLLENARRGIPFPRTKAEARDYFANHMNGRYARWQKKRGFSDFWVLVRACRKYVARFDRNLRDQGIAG